jgi:hypothetical protein
MELGYFGWLPPEILNEVLQSIDGETRQTRRSTDWERFCRTCTKFWKCQFESWVNYRVKLRSFVILRIGIDRTLQLLSKWDIRLTSLQEYGISRLLQQYHREVVSERNLIALHYNAYSWLRQAPSYEEAKRLQIYTSTLKEVHSFGNLFLQFIPKSRWKNRLNLPQLVQDYCLQVWEELRPCLEVTVKDHKPKYQHSFSMPRLLAHGTSGTPLRQVLKNELKKYIKQYPELKSDAYTQWMEELRNLY